MIKGKNTAKEILLILAVAILIITGILIFVFGIGAVGNIYKGTIQKESINIDRENFETSKSYVKGMADDLAKYRYEYSITKDEDAKQALRNVIVSRFADFDGSKLSNANLRKFLTEMRGF